MIPKRKKKKSTEAEGPPVIGLFISDLHWRTSKPEYRKEVCPFNEVITRKFLQVLEYAGEHGCQDIYFTGDMFNGARDFMQFWLFTDLMSQWNHSHDQITLHSVRGQHDMKHHNLADKATSFNLLERYGEVNVLGAAGTTRRGSDDTDFIEIYGCGWGEEYPIPNGANDHNVLVLHKTLWHKDTVYPGQTDGNIAVESVKLNALGYDLVFSGDNHIAFDVKSGGVQFHNIGAFTRNSVDLAEQQPRFCALRADMSVESVYVGETDVFDVKRSDDDKSHGRSKDEFSEALAGGFDHGDTFEGALDKVIATGGCGDLELTPKQLNILRDVRGATGGEE